MRRTSVVKSRACVFAGLTCALAGCGSASKLNARASGPVTSSAAQAPLRSPASRAPGAGPRDAAEAFVRAAFAANGAKACAYLTPESVKHIYRGVASCEQTIDGEYAGEVSANAPRVRTYVAFLSRTPVDVVGDRATFPKVEDSDETILHHRRISLVMQRIDGRWLLPDASLVDD